MICDAVYLYVYHSPQKNMVIFQFAKLRIASLGKAFLCGLIVLVSVAFAEMALIEKWVQNITHTQRHTHTSHIIFIIYIYILYIYQYIYIYIIIMRMNIKLTYPDKKHS